MTARLDVRTPRRLRAADIDGIVLAEGIHPSGSALPWHAHRGPTLCFVLSGAFAEYSRGKSLDCCASTLKITPAEERHWNRFHLTDVRGLQIEIDTARFTAIEPFRDSLAQPRQLGPGPELALMRRIHTEFARMDSASPLAIQGLLLELLAHIARARPASGRGRTPRWVVQAHDILHARLGGRLSLAAIASEVGVHPGTLARAYRRAYGSSLGEMQRRLRLDFAACQLGTTDLPLAEIAQQAGFFDQSHLTNTFRQFMGTSPRRYRRGLRGIA